MGSPGFNPGYLDYARRISPVTFLGQKLAEFPRKFDNIPIFHIKAGELLWPT
jgi:hypothetical protein